MDGDVVPLRIHHKLIFKVRHNLASPAGNGPFVDGEGGIWDDKPLIYALYAAKTAAPWAGPHGAVIAEHLLAWLLKENAVRLKPVGEFAQQRSL